MGRGIEYKEAEKRPYPAALQAGRRDRIHREGMTNDETHQELS